MEKSLPRIFPRESLCGEKRPAIRSISASRSPCRPHRRWQPWRSDCAWTHVRATRSNTSLPTPTRSSGCRVPRGPQIAKGSGKVRPRTTLTRYAAAEHPIGNTDRIGQRYVGGRTAGKAVHERRSCCTVGPNEADETDLGDIEVDIVQGTVSTPNIKVRFER